MKELNELTKRIEVVVESEGSIELKAAKFKAALYDVLCTLERYQANIEISGEPTSGSEPKWTDDNTLKWSVPTVEAPSVKAFKKLQKDHKALVKRVKKLETIIDSKHNISLSDLMQFSPNVNSNDR